MRAPSPSRREFLAEVGRGMFVAALGAASARALGVMPGLAADDGPEGRLAFGARERLVALLSEAPPDKLLPMLVKLLREGTELRDLVAAAALSNARAFGGEDYVGFHTFMALAPAWRMANELPADRRALPVLKVLHRHATRLAERGSAAGDVLKPIAAAAPGQHGDKGEAARAEVMRQAVRKGELPVAEGALAAAAAVSAGQAWNDMLATVHEATEVHRVVLAQRAWDMVALAGPEHALTLLRQSLHYCARSEGWSAKAFAPARTLLPRLLDQHQLPARATGTRAVDDAWIEALSQDLLEATPEQAADAVAAALGEGTAPDAVADAISLTANQLMLRDQGRTGKDLPKNKPAGSVHGDSIGIHACDSAHAWRHIARASEPRNACASLILAGYQVARDRGGRGGSFAEWQPRPGPEALAKVASKDPARLLTELDGAVRSNDQELACAVAGRYLELGHAPRPAFALLLGHAIQADGALHAEKYFWTTSDEFAAQRPAFRGRQLVALARASASQYGIDAPAHEAACKLLGLTT